MRSSRVLFRALLLLASTAAACAPAGSVTELPTTTLTTTTASPAAPSTVVLEPPPAPTIAEPVRTLPLPRRSIQAFPGPDHYAGDVLTFAVPLGGFGGTDLGAATLTVDGAELDVPAQIAPDPLLGNSLVFADAFDTTDAVGGHWVHVTAALGSDRQVDVTDRIVVVPVAGRPVQEAAGSWRTEETACCEVRYLEGTAAERDLDAIVAVIDEAADEVEAYLGLELPRVSFVLIDTLWGNGGYAGSDEVVVSYLDRDYSPGRRSTFRQTVMHELTHAATDQLEAGTPWALIEGVAVHTTRGHFKPESLGGRARALSDAGELPTLAALFDSFPQMQHESRYAAAGAFTDFLVETHGLSTLLDLFADPAEEAQPSRWLDAASRRVLGEGLGELQDEFDVWLSSQDGAAEATDLDLTIALQTARRSFQSTYDPYPNYFVYDSVTETGQISLAERDPKSPRVVAVEAMIAYAQDLIIDGDLLTAEPIVAEIEHIVASGQVGAGPSAAFLDMAESVAAAGYELLSYRPAGDEVTVVATEAAPRLALLEVQRTAGGWTVVSARPAPSSLTALD